MTDPVFYIECSWSYIHTGSPSPGWYFYDTHALRDGPYPTREIAQAACLHYCEVWVEAEMQASLLEMLK